MTALSDPVDGVLAGASLTDLRDARTLLVTVPSGDMVMQARTMCAGLTRWMPALDLLTTLIRAAHPNAHRVTARQAGALRRKVSDAIHEKETPQ